MKKYTLYIGLNDKDTKKQEISTADAREIVAGRIAAMFDGATISDAIGVYRHDDGTLVTEQSIRVELVNADAIEVHKAAGAVRDALNQESVMLDVQEINCMFI